MSDSSLLSNLDKLLLELVFQSEQDSHAKEHAKEQIQINTANVLERKQLIRGLHENISKTDEELFHFQKFCKYSKGNSNAWKPAYLVFNKHEDYLHGQLHNSQESTENDKKMYNEYMNQFRESLNQRHSQYKDRAVAQEYYLKKAELDDLQNKVLINKEQFTRNEAALMELLEPPPFQSCNDWALRIVSLRHNTDEVLKSAFMLMHKTSTIEKEAVELELKNTSIKQFQEISQVQNVSEIRLEDHRVEGKDFEERLSQERQYYQLANEKPHPSHKLLLPCNPYKSIRPLQGFTLSLQFSEADGVEKESSVGKSTINNIHSNQIISENAAIQKCNDTTENEHSKYFQVPKNLQSQMHLRLSVPQKQASKQWFYRGATETGSTDTDKHEMTNASKDSAYASQDVLTESFKSAEYDAGRTEDHSEIFSRTPEPLLFSRTSMFPSTPETPTFSNTPESSDGLRIPMMGEFEKKTEPGGNKGLFPKTSAFEISHNFGCEVQTEKSPSFSFLSSTSKTSRFNLFESSLFGTPNSPEQNNESFSDFNINPTPSPQKDTGSFFGKTSGDDEFSFSFPSESSHAFGDGKDDFSFPFLFGQDQKSSHGSSFKGLQTSQDAMQFTLF